MLSCEFLEIIRAVKIAVATTNSTIVLHLYHYSLVILVTVRCRLHYQIFNVPTLNNKKS